MGLNVNYSLLIEGNNSTSYIPEYKNYYKPGFFMQSELAACISEFNQELRESREFLSNLYEVESVNESTAAVNIVNGIKFVADKVKKAVMKVMGIIIEGLKKAIDAMEKFASNARTKIDMKLRPNERINILRDILKSGPVATINIASIEPTNDLLDKSFPDTSILGSDLVKMATETMKNYCVNILIKDGADADTLDRAEVKYSESFVTFIENSKNKMLSKIFGKYEYDETAVTRSAYEVADKAFGSSTKKEITITDHLYLLACDNLEKNALNGTVRDMKAIMDEVQKNYKAVVKEMDDIADATKQFDKMTSNKYSINMKERYYKATKTITDRINRALNVIQTVVNVNFVLVTRKAARTYEIYGVMGDSARVKRTCDMMILKYIASGAGYGVEDAKYKDLKVKIEEASTVSRSKVIDLVNKALEENGLKSHISKNSEWGSKRFIEGKDDTLCLGSFNKDTWNKASEIVKQALPEGYTCNKDNYFTIFVNAPKAVQENYDVFNGREEAEEFFQIQDDFNTTIVMAEEAFLEEEFTGVVMTAILEADGDQQQGQNTTANDNSSTPQPTETTTTQKTNIVKKAGTAVIEFVQKLIGSLGQAMQRFKNRIDELIIKNPVNQKYWANNKDNIKKLTLTDTSVNEWYQYNIDYFANSTFIKFDQNDPKLKTDEDFQNAIISKITNGGNIPAFEKDDSFAQKINKVYQGEFVKIDNGEGKTLRGVGYDHAKAFAFVDEMITKGFGGDILGKVSNDYKEIDTDFKAVKRNYDSIAAQMKPVEQKAEEKANEVNDQKPEPQNAAAMVEDDFRFNLAEHFGLIHNEASFTVGKSDAASANANGANETVSEKNKELDDMIKRCFRYNTIAVTAKMTAALGAYKQYMALFKAVYKPSKKDKPSEEEQKNTKQENKPAE